MKLLLTFLLATVLIAAVDAGSIKIRMAEAYNSENPAVSSQLNDVVPLLKKSLNFNSYALLGIASVSTPANSKVSINGYEILCKGDSKRMQVTLFHNKKSILKSNLIFNKNKPVIIGGFNGSKGKIFFIFTR